MTVCANCGHANEADAAFCGSCGSFLEWDGQRVEPVGKPLVSVARTDAVSPSDSPAHGEVEPLRERMPEAERPRTQPVRPVVLDPGVHDLYCGRCGAGNTADRFFCRSCGSSLAAAVPVETLTWWQRFTAWLRRLFGREPRDLSVGERPSNWSTSAATASTRKKRPLWKRVHLPTRISLGSMALPILILAVVGFGIAPIRYRVTNWGFSVYESARRTVMPRYVPVAPANASASDAAASHPAAAAIDQNLLTWWGAARPGDGSGSTLTMTFERPADIAKIGFHDGAADADFPLQPRVRELEVTLSDERGQVAAERVTLADKRDLQTFDVKGHGVRSATVRVVSTYAGQKGQATAMAEVSFFTKK